MSQIRKGARFVHRHWLAESGEQQVYVISRVASGVVYYRAVYMDNGIETLGSPFKATVDTFPKFVDRWLTA